MTNKGFIWALYTITIFFGAFLMFLIQPLVGKIVTPQYGGTSQVWCLCLLYFQIILLGGYTLTYLLCKLTPRKQAIIYICLLAVSIFLLKIPLGDGWIPGDINHPIISLLTNLVVYLTPPVLVLCTISTIIQKWYNNITNENPYYLYGISNIGSMLSLLLYPVVIEPHFTIESTLKIWKISYIILFSLAVIASIVLIFNIKSNSKNEKSIKQEKLHIPIKNYMLWIFLSACGTTILISFTSHITHDISPVPLLWVVPLAIYLFTFILCFGNKKIYSRLMFINLTYLFLFVIALVSYFQFNQIGSFIIPVILNLALMFSFCMICNGEIYETRPDPEKLPLFYLAIAFGGVLGGVFVNIVAPVIFSDYSEYLIIIFVMIMFTAYIAIQYFETKLLNKKTYVVLVILSTVMLIFFIFSDIEPHTIVKIRNFYGTAKVAFTNKKDKLVLLNGTTKHGLQLYDISSGRPVNKPTSYYGEYSGIGIADYLTRSKKNNNPIKMGIIGLGTATIAYYGQKNDEITFYEIDPKIKKIAEEQFTFLKDSKAKINILMGDGRLLLKRQKPQHFDILVIDAFNSDSIPIHLITIEAINLYLTHVKKDGLILFHISNRFLDLNKVLGNLSIAMGFKAITIISSPSASGPVVQSKYIVLCKNDWFNKWLLKANLTPTNIKLIYSYPKWQKNIGVWTDNYSNIFSVLSFKAPN